MAQRANKQANVKSFTSTTIGNCLADDTKSENVDDLFMLQAREGDHSAFGKLMRRYQSNALRVAAKYVGNAQAEDVVQETFWNIHRALGRYKPDGKFKSYFYRVLIRQCQMEFRRSKREMRRREAKRLEHSTADKNTSSPVLKILGDERDSKVQSALLRLNKKHREVVALRFVGELSYEEIAEVTSLSVGTVKSRLFRGLEKMRTHLKGDL